MSDRQHEGPGAPEDAARDRHAAPPGAHAMNVVRWVLFGALLVLAVASIASYVSWRMSVGKDTHAAKAALYHCPMHPTYTSDRPGECPICGMSLEPITESENAAESGDVHGLTGVTIDFERQQLIGVRTAVVSRRALSGALDLVGFVTPDEARVKRVQIRASGWVQKLEVNTTGEVVRAGQPLLTIYSPELYQSEREYLIERSTPTDTSHVHGHGSSEASTARTRLTLLGIPDEEIARLEREGTAAVHLTLRAPVDGTVLERGVSEGQYVGADTPLYTVADLSRLWVIADLYEMDFRRLRTGDRVEFVADALPGRTFAGRVDFIYPTVSDETRTLKVRVVVDNADGALRPGMYGRVEVQGSGPKTLTLPTESVIRTGTSDYVFVARHGGRFEPRLVRLGVEDGDRVQVLGGVAEGDTVVSSASFLIDSESRLRAAISGMGAQPGGGGSKPHAH